MGIIQRNHLDAVSMEEEPKKKVVISFKEGEPEPQVEEEAPAVPEGDVKEEEPAPAADAPDEKPKKKGGRPRKNVKK